MRFKRLTAAVSKVLTLTAASSVFSISLWLIAPSATETAVANGDTRTIHFYHTHTGESIDATFRVDGHYDQAVLDKLNYFLRDWRNNDQIRMDPRLFDVLWEVYRTAGAGDTPIQIYSAYRSPETNAMLRRRSRAVAEHSQHMLGRAMDTTMPGMSMEKIREIAMRLQRGGVGYYQTQNFVHIDVGGVRSWPRMNYDQLARLFPDGKTVHIPSNGHPMPGYEEARAEIAARGGTDVPPTQQSQGFFAWLFGGSGNSEDNVPSGAPTPRPVAVAYAQSPEGDEAGEAVARPRPAVAPASAPAVEASVAEPATATDVSLPGAAPAAPAATVRDDTLPLPPHRPLELVALATDLPLPPVRPDAGFSLRVASATDQPLPTPITRPPAVPDAIGGLISSARGVPVIRTAALPAIITQGTERRHLPAGTLGFAAMDGATDIARAVPSRTGKPLTLRGGVAGLRLERRQARGAGSAQAIEAASPAPLAGPAIVGLRRAAKGLTVDASL